ncbi:SDR family NAD(P)-dependent oxidoreductase [Neorhizobium sp. P12A]|uniref:SDR family oxidoreductase n=1 Tax=Neorhizobium sp. P12A TaxID=2268027 RepID=UPI0011EC5946|nr:SDR family oxidoreductase [Neorhizobium sp. P12A]KAA0700950.1 SDR family NAD(P)-dependent oxidoreductase [Neorhizobium sp. P12A]
MSSQHAVIVGGSSGVGLATAGTLLARGFRVTITGRDAQRLEKAKASLRGDVHALAIDAADAASVAEGFSVVGPFDHLVLAMSGGRGGGPFASVQAADIRAAFDEKMFPHFATAQAALPSLSKTGSITFVSAVSAHAALPGTAGLGAVNAAVDALVPILANELKPLRVNSVSPGVLDTPWWDFLAEEQKAALFAEYAAKTPVGRIGRPEDVAEAIAFLIGNSFMTGHVLICDGGVRLAIAS